MPIFTKKFDKEYVASIEEQITRLEGALKAKYEESDLVDKNNGLKEQIKDQEINLAKVKEDHDREIREVEHKVGLAQTKSEQDREAAVKEAELKVREANLDADTKRAKDQMDFERAEMQKRSDSIEDLLGKVLDRLPNHNVNQNIHEFRGDPTDEQKKLVSGEDTE